MLEIAFFLGAAIVVGPVAALSAYLANRRSPYRSIRQIMDRVISWLAIATFVLSVAGCYHVMSRPCAPEASVCDAPAMAAAGSLVLGGLVLVAVLVIGIPAAYVTLKLVRLK
jgi:hypothetical protein